MIATNWAMRQAAGVDPLALVDPAAVPPELASALESGWTIEPNGALVIRSLREAYHGPDARPGDLTGYEAAVNGRGLPGPGIDEHQLLVQAISYARQGLLAASGTAGHEHLTALVSLSLSGDEPPKTTGTVKFFVSRDDEPPYVGDVESYAFESLLVFDYAEVGGLAD